jgi:FkbM family methyltransferase
MAGQAIIRAINGTLASLAGLKIVKAHTAESALHKRLKASREMPTDGLTGLRAFVAASLSRGDPVAFPARINGDLYWILADVLPYLENCQNVPMTNADLVPGFEIEGWNYFALRDNAKAGDTVFDIGGSVGIMSIMLSRQVGATGRVYTFEPNPAVRPQLAAMLKANGASNVEIVPYAVSDNVGNMDFMRITEANVQRESSSLKIHGMPSESMAHEIITVPVTTVDIFANEIRKFPNLMKIDVEGADLEAIMGAKKTIQDCHPIIQLELHDIGAEAEAAVMNFLSACNYKITRHENQLLCI